MEKRELLDGLRELLKEKEAREEILSLLFPSGVPKRDIMNTKIGPLPRTRAYGGTVQPIDDPFDLQRFGPGSDPQNSDQDFLRDFLEERFEPPAVDQPLKLRPGIYVDIKPDFTLTKHYPPEEQTMSKQFNAAWNAEWRLREIEEFIQCHPGLTLLQIMNTAHSSGKERIPVLLAALVKKGRVERYGAKDDEDGFYRAKVDY